METGVLELQASPGSRRRRAEPSSPSEKAKFFVSRYHDYAEIVSDDEAGRDDSKPSSTTDMQELVEKLDSKLSSAASCYMRDREDSSEPEAKLAKLDGESKEGETSRQALGRVVERVAASSSDVPHSTQVVRRRAEWIPSDRPPAAQPSNATTEVEFKELTPRLTRRGDAALPPLPHQRSRQITHHPPATTSTTTTSNPSMAKCLSVPSDIAQSLENVTASHNDLLASVTISELSQSVTSCCAGAADNEVPTRDDPRWRRSASLDSMEKETTMCRTLRDINAQMDAEFHHKVDRAIQLEGEGYSRHAPSPSSDAVGMSQDSLATPIAVQETHFPACPDSPVAPSQMFPPSPGGESPAVGHVSHGGDLPLEGAISTVATSLPPLQPNTDYNPDYAEIEPQQPGAQTQDDFPDYAVIKKHKTTPDTDLQQSEAQPLGHTQNDFPEYAVVQKPKTGPKVEGDQADTQPTRQTQDEVPQYAVVNKPRTAPQGDSGISGNEPFGDFSSTAPELPLPSVLESARMDVQYQTGGQGVDTPVDILTAGPQVPAWHTEEREEVGREKVGSNLSHPPIAGCHGSEFLPSPSWMDVRVVKRQRNSSSSSSTSSDSSRSHDLNDPDIDHRPGIQGGGGQNSHPDLYIREPVDVSECSNVPGDLRQFSPQDILWRQYPRSGQGSREEAVIPASGKRGTDPREQYMQSGPCVSGAAVCPPGHEGMVRGAAVERSPSDSVDTWHGITPRGGEAFPSSPSSQRSLPPLPPSPTLQQSYLPSHHSPELSTGRVPLPHTAPVCESAPSVRSDLVPQEAAQHTEPSRQWSAEGSSGVPLHLMLYHPDEFQLPSTVVGMATGSALPEVHVSSDMVVEEKAVIRKTYTGQAPAGKQQEQSGMTDVPGHTWTSSSASEPSSGNYCLGLVFIRLSREFCNAPVNCWM